MQALGFFFMGVKTAHFEATRSLFADAMGLDAVKDEAGDARFRLPGGEVHVYAEGDADHDFFGSGPVVGFLVEDFATARRQMTAHGIEFIGAPQQDDEATWNHFRGPDGNVYEIMQRH